MNTKLISFQYFKSKELIVKKTLNILFAIIASLFLIDMSIPPKDAEDIKLSLAKEAGMSNLQLASYGYSYSLFGRSYESTFIGSEGKKNILKNHFYSGFTHGNILERLSK